MGERKALIIGVNEYEDKGFIPLKYAINDAQDICKILTNKDIGAFYHEDVILIENPTRSEVETNLGKMLEEAKEKDFVFIYFAGHGKLDKSGRLCLATRDTKADIFVTNSIRLDYLQSIFNQCDCKSITLIIDSCYSGTAGESFRGDISTESFKQISGHGKVIISASQNLEKSRESDELRHGIFTYYVLKGLSDGEADGDNDGTISINELYTYVCENVKTATNGRQEPKGWGIDESTKIILAKNIKVLQRKHEEIRNKSHEAGKLLNEEKFRDAIALWNSILKLDSTNPEAHRALDEEIPELMEKKLARLFRAQASTENFPNEIYEEARKIICMPISRVKTNGKEEDHGLITKLLNKENPLPLKDFIRTCILTWDKSPAEKPRTGSFQAGTSLEPNRAPTVAGQETLPVLKTVGKEKDRTSIQEQPKLYQEPLSAKEENAKQETMPAEKEFEVEKDRAGVKEPAKSEREQYSGKVPRNQIFISYSHEDKRWMKKLCEMLKPLVKKDLIKVWADTDIKTGKDWRNEIKGAIDTARVGILLVSAKFLASDFIMEDELPPLLEAAEKDGLTIFTIFVRECQYGVTQIERYQAANAPSKPLASYRAKSDQDHELNEICKKIMKAVEYTE